MRSLRSVTKKCSKCGVNKPCTSEFFKPSKLYKDGFKSQCKDCIILYQKNFRLANADEVRQKRRNKYHNIRDKLLKWDKDSKRRIKDRSIQDPEYDKCRKTKRNKYLANRRKLDPIFRIKYYLRNKIRKLVKNKTQSFNEYIGCTGEELKKHIENQFAIGMTWDNQGEWHIDHRIPLDSATSEDEIYRLNHYTNLQPLWASDNLRKSNKMPTL